MTPWTFGRVAITTLCILSGTQLSWKMTETEYSKVELSRVGTSSLLYHHCGDSLSLRLRQES